MTPNSTGGTTRRDVLKTLGVAGVASVAGLSGTAVADQPPGRSFGNGNGIGAFLNEKAAEKETPIWTGQVADYRGQSDVTVENGVNTEIIPQEIELGPPFGTVTLTEAPVAFDPLVTMVSPGARVHFEWSDDVAVLVPGVLEFAFPHNVVALPDKDGVVAFDSGTPVVAPETFSHTFEEAGTYLYYCTPHGGLDPVQVPGEDEEVYNAFGMRGAILVKGRPV